MQLEFHRPDRRWEHLRVREPHRQRRLPASLADGGQQTPIVAVVSQDNPERYLGAKVESALAQERGRRRSRIGQPVTPWILRGGILRENTVAVKTLISLVHMPHQEHGSRKAIAH